MSSVSSLVPWEAQSDVQSSSKFMRASRGIGRGEEVSRRGLIYTSEQYEKCWDPEHPAQATTRSVVEGLVEPVRNGFWPDGSSDRGWSHLPRVPRKRG